MKLLLTSTVQFFAPKLSELLDDDLANKNVLCIPTAAYAEEGYERWLTPELEAIRSLVQRFTEFDITNKTPSDFHAALEGIDILYVTGGNTYCLLETMNKIGFKDILVPFLKAGGLYLGSSAGSIVTGPDISFVGDIDDPLQSSLRDFTAMGLVGFLIMPHMDQESFNVEARRAITSYNGPHQIIALNDDQAILVEDGTIKLV